MSLTICCVPNCYSTRDSNAILHLFPNPDKDFSRFLTWVNTIGGDIATMKYDTVFKMRRVCHLHFEQRYQTRSSRLSANAVPTLRLSGTATVRSICHPPLLINKSSSRKCSEQTGPCSSNVQPAACSAASHASRSDCSVGKLQNEVCRICFTNDCRLYSMMSYKALSKAYETLTGLLVEYDDPIPPYLCSECARQLQNCVRFRNTSLKAHLMLLDIVKFHGHVTLDLIQSVKDQSSLSLNQTDCDLDIELPERDNIYTDTQADIKHSHGPCNVDLAMKVNIKVEKNHNVINKDNNSPETTINEELGCIPSLPENIIDDIKIEESEINQDHAKADSINADMKHEHEFVDEDYSSDVKDGSEEARQIAKPSNTTMQEITEVPKNSTQAKVDMHRIPGLTKNKLCCDICPYKTNNELHWSNHLKVHKAAVYYSCNMCTYITTRKSTLINHAKIHSGVKPYSCGTCNKAFIGKRQLEVHLRIHEKSYSCKKCHKSFYVKEGLKKHMESHFGVKIFMCNKCNKSFNCKAHHKQHMRTHTGKKTFPCEICKKSFKLKGTRKRHMMIHTGEKPFSCDICSKSFTQKGTLEVHMRSHPGPSSCNICNNSQNLTLHMRTHSGIKQFICDICNKSFIHKFVLILHMKTHFDIKEILQT